MNKIVRWYNENKMRIWIGIFAIALAIAIPRALNNYVKNKRKNEISSSNESITTTYGNKDYSIISGETIEKEIANKNNSIINSFLDYCIKGNIENAYNLLSTNCKKKFYPNLESFENKYYKVVFENKETYNVQAWYINSNCYTYKIDLTEDLLSTGNINAEHIEDYYTIVNENGTRKLNINGYVTTENINKSNENNNIKIDVLSKDVYMDYEIYNLKVESKMVKSILLDSLEKTNGMYIQDKKGLKYNSFSHEKIQEELRVKSIKNMDIKFNKKYTTTANITKIVFTDIILDFDNYLTYKNKNEYKERGTLEIEL